MIINIMDSSGGITVYDSQHFADAIADLITTDNNYNRHLSNIIGVKEISAQSNPDRSITITLDNETYKVTLRTTKVDK
jgi:hypothetical protein